MPQEVVTLKIELEGKEAAEQAIKDLDKLSDDLDNKEISLSVDTSSLQAFSKEVEKSIQAATKNINAQARLLKAKNEELAKQAQLQKALNEELRIRQDLGVQAKISEQEVAKAAQAQAKATAEAEKAKQQIEKTAQAEAKLATEAQKTATVEEKRQLLAEQMSAAYEKANMKAEALNASTSEVSSTPLQQQIEALTGVSDEYKSAAESAKVFEEVAKKAGEATGDKISTDSISTKGFSEYINGLEGMQGATVAATKTVKAADSTFQQFSVSVKNGAGDYDNFTYSVDKATGSIYKMEEGASSANKTASKLQKTLGGAVAEFAKWAVVGALFYAPIQAFSDALTELKKVDSELVNIQKVMGATAGEMEQLSEKAFEVGSSLGVAASDYLASVTKWAQAGYGSLSDELGELSVKTQKVGDVEEATANQFLLSVDAAYKYKGSISELTKVLDGANEISNNYATSVDKLASGMGIVSSLAAQAGMEVQETMAAIGTITAVTQESGNSAARALRALILNIQGSTEIAIDEETGERWTEDEIEQTAAALGDLNIATREYKDGVEQLRKPMEVIGELSDKYKAGLIDEVQLQEVVSSLGGKVRSNQLQALISNYDMYEEMLNTYSTSVGSADRELDIYLNSWEAKANRLKNQWVEFVDSMKASEISKALLDVGNALLSIANTDIGTTIIQVAALSAAITALAIAYSNYAKAKASADSVEAVSNLGGLSKAVGAVKEFGASFLTAGSAIKDAVLAIKGGGGLTAALGALTASTGGTLLAVVAVVAAIAGLIKLVDVLTVTTEEHWENAKKAREEYDEATASINEMTSAMEENRKKIEELNATGPLSLTDQSDLDNLKAQNALLQVQIDLEKEKQKIAANTAFKESAAALEGTVTVMGNSTGMDQVDLLEFYMDTIDELEGKLKESGISPEDDDTFVKYQEKYIELAQQFTTAYENATIAAEFGSESAKEWLENNKNVIDSISMFGREAEWAVEQIDDLASSSKDFADALSSVKADGVVTAKEVEGLIQRFPELKEILEKSGFSAEDLAEHLNSAAKQEGELETATDGASESLDEQSQKTETLSEKLDNAISAMRNITDAQDELNKTGKLSIDTVVGLIEKYPELNNVLTMYLAGLASEADLQAALSEEYDRNANEYKQAILDKMADSEEFYNAVVLGNEQTVAKLKALGLEDLDNYRTVEDLKSAAHTESENKQTRDTAEGTKSRILMYQKQLSAYLKMLNATNTGGGVVGSINRFLGSVGGALQTGLSNSLKEVEDTLNSLGPSVEEIDKILASGISLPDLSDSSSSGSSSKSSSSSSAKSWYETQIEALQDLVSSVKDTNTLLEKEDKNSAEKRIQNLMETQATISKMADAFRAKGLSNSSDEVKQLKLMWHDLADEIEAAYQSMYDALMDEQGDKEWSINLFEKNADRADKSVEEISADNEKIVASYKEMQEEVAQLAAYYRSKGYDETDDLIQDLSDAWWDYQDKIESVYDRLSEAFEDYISESDRQIKELERTTGTAGQQIELYTQRIQEAQKAIAELQKTNVNGLNDDRIGSIQDQIYSDEDAISSIQDSLWQELVDAVDREFDKKQDEIDEAQKEVDRINEILSEYDKQLAEELEPLQEAIKEAQDALEKALDPIEEQLDSLNKRLEAEKEALEALTDPLRKEIEGYYQINPDGTLGVYVPGLNDEIEDLQDQLDKVNEEWDEQQKREEEALALQKKELALQEAIKKLQQAQLDLETAKNERTVYTLKDGVWAWRPDEEAIKEAEDALADAEQAKEDAEKELEDLKEEQAHDKIVSALEDQIEALEKQKDLINKQIEAYEKESEARQDYLQDQIDYWEKEKEAQEDYYNAIIEANEKEIEAREEYYENLKAQYDDELEFWENRVDELQKQYDEWADQWDDIQDAMTDDVRSIEEILADIANYGTPQMKEQIDKVTDLLEQMGVAIGDFNASIGGSTGGGTSGGSEVDIIEQMKQNAQAWKDAMAQGNQAAADYYYDQNQMLGAQIGATFNRNNGVWYDRYGNELFSTDYNDWGTDWGTTGGSSSGNGESPTYGGNTSSGGGASTGSSENLTHEQAVIAEMKKNAEAWKVANANGYTIEAERLQKLNNALGQSIGATKDKISGVWYGADGNRLFDHGGIAEGRGVMLKAVDEPEMVLSPVLASTVLNPVQNVEFDRFTKDLGILFGASGQYAQSTQTIPANTTTNHTTDSHNTYINGVQIGESLMEKPLSEVLSLLGLYQNM